MDRAVSVIVPTFNRAHFLSQCLDALFSQTVPPAEIIVVNDGSTDNTKDVLAAYKDRIVYLEKKNGGKASALNLGLSKAKGEFIWIFDDDDVSLPNALKIHLDALKANPSIDFTYAGYHIGVPDPETGDLKIVETFEPFQGPAKSLFLSFAIGASGPQIGFMLQQGMLVRKHCFDAAGPFDEALIGSEDRDMNLRLCRFFKGLRIDRPTFILRRHEGLRGPSHASYSYAERERKLWETDRIVYRKIYEATPLQMYLDEVATGNNEGWRGEALMTRARIMAKRHLDDLATKDLAGLKKLADEGDVTLSENILRGALLVEALYRRSERVNEAQAFRKKLLQLPGMSASHRKYIAKYYYWRGIDECRKGRPKELLKGIAGAVEVLLGDYGKRLSRMRKV